MIEEQVRRRRYRRITLWSFAGILLGAMLLPLLGYLYVGVQNAIAQEVSDTNPRANYWRAVRDGVQGYSAVTGKAMPGEAGNDWKNMRPDVLIQNGGQNWRQLRNRVLAPYGSWVLAAVVALIVLFFAVRQRIKIEGGPSGMVVPRWTWWERLIHWYTAILFVVLAVTGLSLLFGRYALIPLLGLQGFAAYADVCRWLHEGIGPAFGIGVALMVVFWVGHNVPEKGDGRWFAKGGGFFGKSHPSAGFANAGEKVWFWIVALVGGVVIISGLALAGQVVLGELSREGMQLTHLVHGSAAVFWVAVWLGHAYIGTLGTEGALQGMTSGYVDANWARQHHDRWYETVKDQAVPAEGGGAPPAGAGEPART